MQFDYGAQVYLDQCFFSGAVKAVNAFTWGGYWQPDDHLRLHRAGSRLRLILLCPRHADT